MNEAELQPQNMRRMLTAVPLSVAKRTGSNKEQK
jgi:hypothetical protein